MNQDPQDLMRRATLRQEIQSQHDALSEVAPDTDAYHGRVAKVLDATDALVDHDSAVRARLRARAQRASLGTMRRSGAGVAVVMALLLLACVSGWIGVWWALLVLPSTALATGMFVLGGRRPDVEPRRLYAGTAAAGMAALGVVALVLGAPSWILLPVLIVDVIAVYFLGSELLEAATDATADTAR